MLNEIPQAQETTPSLLELDFMRSRLPMLERYFAKEVYEPFTKWLGEADPELIEHVKRVFLLYEIQNQEIHQRYGGDGVPLAERELRFIKSQEYGPKQFFEQHGKPNEQFELEAWEIFSLIVNADHLGQKEREGLVIPVGQLNPLDDDIKAWHQRLRRRFKYFLPSIKQDEVD